MSGNTKRSGKQSAARKIAFCGVFAALSMVMLYIGGLTVLDMTVLVACSLITLVVTVETGFGTGWLYAAVTAALALILLPSKFYAIQYILFSAVYPMIRPIIERLAKRAAFPVKIAVLDLMLVGCLVLGKYVFAVGDAFFSLSAVTVILGTLFFILYDYALTVCIRTYIVKIRKKINISKFL